LLLIAVPATAQVNAVWTNPTGGAWDNGANWSTNPAYPDNGGSTTYNATIDLTGNAYTVSLGVPITIENFLLNSSSATLQHTAGTFTVNGTANLSAGTYVLNGGTIAGGTWNVAPGTFQFANNSNNRFDGVRFVGDLDLTTSYAKLHIAGGLDMEGNINVTGHRAALAFEGEQTLDHTVVTLVGDGSYRSSFGVLEGGVLTLGPDLLLNGDGARIEGPGSVVNRGTISASVAGHILEICPTSFVNDGTIQAVNGGQLNIGYVDRAWINTASGNITATGSTLTLGGDWANAGTITAVDSTVVLGGSFSTADLAGFSRSGGTVDLDGSLNNEDATLELSSTSGPWYMDMGYITCGTINVADPSFLEFDGSSHATFDNTTINGDLSLEGYVALQNGAVVNGDVETTRGTLALYSGADISGSISVSGSRTELRYGDSRTIDGKTITFAGGTYDVEMTGSSGVELTFGPDLLIHGGNAVIGGNYPDDPFDAVNYGTISADVSGQELTLRLNAFTNHGSMEAVNGGILRAGSYGMQWENAADGRIDVVDSKLVLDGAWTNAGVINATNATVVLGGEFATADIGNFNRTASTAILAGELDNTGSTLTLDESDGEWQLGGGTITGGTIDMAGGDGVLAVTSISTSGSLTYLDNVTVNADILMANSTFDDVLHLRPSATINGEITVLHENELYVDTGRTLDNTTIHLSGPNSTMTATLRARETGQLTLGPNLEVYGDCGCIATSGYTDVSILNQGLIAAEGGGTMYICQSFTNAGTVRADEGSRVSFEGSPTNAAGGQIVTTGGTLMFAEGWDNLGTITANQGEVSFDPSHDNYSRNAGLIDVAESTLRFNGHWINEGTINAHGSTVELAGWFSTDSLDDFNVDDCDVYIKGHLDNANNTFTLDGSTGSWTMSSGDIIGGTIVQADGARLCFASGTTSYLDGVTVLGDLHATAAVTIRTGLELNGDLYVGGQGSRVSFPQGYTLDDLTVHLGADSLPGVATLSTLGAFTLGEDLVVRGGAGLIQGANLENYGHVTADVAGKEIQLAGDLVTNHGVLTAVNGGGIRMNSGQATPWTNAADGIITGDGGTLCFIGPGLNQGVIAANDGVDVWQDLFNEGTLDVGVGSLWAFHGTFAQAPWAEMLLHLDGGCGLLDVDGNAQLGGLLSVILDPGFSPMYGDTFEFLTAGARLRTFSDVSLPDLPGVLRFEIEYGATNALLRVVPEPSTLLLLGAAALTLFRRRG
jgi:hypothetical protein